MKKLFIIMGFIIMTLLSVKVYAQPIEISYSSWSTDYPNGIPQVFIESSDRYHFYRIVDGQVEYLDDYYESYDGYIKDEKSKRTYYRYITNPRLVFKGNNELVTDTDYCAKAFCYIVERGEVTMVDTLGKETENYTEEDRPIVQQAVVPFTIDKITYYVLALTISLAFLIAVLIIRKRKSYSIIKA